MRFESVIEASLWRAVYLAVAAKGTQLDYQCTAQADSAVLDYRERSKPWDPNGTPDDD